MGILSFLRVRYECWRYGHELPSDGQPVFSAVTVKHPQRRILANAYVCNRCHREYWAYQVNVNVSDDADASELADKVVAELKRRAKASANPQTRNIVSHLS